ncbi:MAG: potassium channel family protein [Phycisphaerae bacterium]|nr:potassium channel family protein [Phycisphaerae bacterium]
MRAAPDPAVLIGRYLSGMARISPPIRSRRTARAIEPVPTKVTTPDEQATAERQDSVYHIYMAALAMLAILVSVGLFVSPSEPDVIGVLTVVDFVLCLFFFYDFLRHLWKAPSKLKYLCGWGIIDLLSSFPFVLETRWLRLARLLRFLMLLRAARVLWESAKVERRSITMACATFLIQTLFIVICIVVLHFEHSAPDGNIRTAGDVLWWAMTTVTTVGYGDRFPVTIEGRVAGAVLMISGIGYLATVLGVVAQTFVPKHHDR